MNSNTCVVLVHSPLHSEAFINEVEGKIRDAVPAENYIGRIYEAYSYPVTKCDGYIYVMGTGGTESIIWSLVKEFNRVPTLLVAYDVANSLPALMEVYPIVKSENRNLSYIVAKYDDLEKYLKTSIKIMDAARRVKNARLGLIGGISEWLVYSTVSIDRVKERLGSSLIEIPIDKLYEFYEGTNMDDANGELEGLLDTSTSTVPIDEVKKAFRVYKALEAISRAYDLDGFSIKCFDVIKKLRTTACLAVSLFNSKLIPAGCEGDVPSLLSMMMLMYLTDKPAFMGNPSNFDGNKMMLAHCTAPLSMSKGKPVLKTHFESGLGVGIAITFPRGEVTFLRLYPDLSKARVFKGKIFSGEPMSARHCRSQAWIELSFNASKLLDKSVGNHYVFIEGDHVSEIKALLDLMDIEPELL